MRRQTRENCKDLTLTLLKIIAAGGGAALLYGASRGRGGKEIKKALSQYADWRIKQTFKQIRLRRLIKRGPRDELEPIALTEKGWRRLNLNEKTRVKSNIREWDLLWRILVFDISNHNKRNTFRSDIQKIGWKKLQQSVYVNPLGNIAQTKNCIEYHHLQRRCVLLTAADLGTFEKPLRKFFFKTS